MPDIVSEKWHLITYLCPVFTSKVPSLKVHDESRSVREILENLKTLFEFESWLLPEALQEVQAQYELCKNPCQEFPSILDSLLGLFEQSVEEGVLEFHPHQERPRHISSTFPAYPKLEALKFELERRHRNKSGNLLGHARELEYLVWTNVTIEQYYEIVATLERFNKGVNCISSSTTDDIPPQGSAHPWKDDELQTVREARNWCKNMNTLFQTFAEGLKNCNSSHSVMLHLTGFWDVEVDMLLSSCSDSPRWRQTTCSVAADEKLLSNVRLQGADRISDFCAILRLPRHKLLRIFCSTSEMWHKSEQILPTPKAHPTISLLRLLEERAPGRANANVAPILSKKTKKIIAVILASSLLKLCGSPWLQKGWDADSLYFMHDPKADEILDLQRPYFVSNLVWESSDEADTANPNYHLPIILAFGILLMELELDQSIAIIEEDEQEADEGYPPIYMTLLRIFLLRKEDLDDCYLLQAINSCLEFSNRVDSIKHPSFDNDFKVRAAILRYIVQPLSQRLEAAHPEVSLDTTILPQHSVKAKFSRVSYMRDEESSSTTRTSSTTTTPNLPAGERLSGLQSIPPQFASCGEAGDPTATSLPPSPRGRRDFEIVIICALPLEADAVQALFDRRLDINSYGKAQGDQNAYSAGVMGCHNVVLAHMPGMGRVSAAIVAAHCRSSFRGIKLALVVGICGGVPFTKDREEILLGDVVISDGIVQHGFGRQFPDRFVRKDTLLDNLGRPNMEIRALLAKLRGRSGRKAIQGRMSEHLSALQKEFGEAATYPGASQDKLFEPSYRHKHQIPSSCAACAACKQRRDPVCEASVALKCEQLGCDLTKMMPRCRLTSINRQPFVHFGLVASGDAVMKSGEDRDEFAAEEDVIAFEMEGAGVWDNFPACLVIKGVCDYADSHKSKQWQNYAAAAAAACMKAALENWGQKTWENILEGSESLQQSE